MCVLRIAGSGPGRKGNSRLSGEDSMAASGPSQAKRTAKESSGEESRGDRRRGGNIEDISRDVRKGQSDDRGNF